MTLINDLLYLKIASASFPNNLPAEILAATKRIQDKTMGIMVSRVWGGFSRSGADILR